MHFRRSKEAEQLGREARQQADRKLTWHDSDGMLVITARLPAEAGQMFIKPIEAAQEEVSVEDVSAETYVSAETPNVKFLLQPSARKANAQVHEGNVVVLALDDGAIRLATPSGKSFDSTPPNHTQPLGDWHELVATNAKSMRRCSHRSKNISFVP